MTRVAAMRGNFSSHWEMFVTGGRFGGGGRPGTSLSSSSKEISVISTNSKLRILLTTFPSSTARGLNGPGVCSCCIRCQSSWCLPRVGVVVLCSRRDCGFGEQIQAWGPSCQRECRARPIKSDRPGVASPELANLCM